MEKATEAVLVEPYIPRANDPFIEKQRRISAWVEAAVRELGIGRYYHNIDLQSLPEGKLIFDVGPAEAADIVVAAVEQINHWKLQADQIRSTAETEIARMNAHLLPGWPAVWGRRRQVENVISTLMRRKLPFSSSHLKTLLAWCNSETTLSTRSEPVGPIVKALQRLKSANDVDKSLRDMMQLFAQKLRSSYSKDAKRYATTVEQMLGDCNPSNIETYEVRPLVPVAAGNPSVLVQLKQHLGLIANDQTAFEQIGPDHFPLREDSPFRGEHGLLSDLFQEVIGKFGYAEVDLSKTPTGRNIAASQPAELARLQLAVAERDVAGCLAGNADYRDYQAWQARTAASSVAMTLSRKPSRFGRWQLFDFILFLAVRPNCWQGQGCELVLKQVKVLTDESPLTDGERYALALWRGSLVHGPLLGSLPDQIVELNHFISDGAGFYLVPDETWTAGVNEDIQKRGAADRTKWVALLKHWLTATPSRPSDKWLKVTAVLVKDIGARKVNDALQKWLSQVPSGRALKGVPGYAGDMRSTGDIIQQENANCLRGMLWTVPTLKNDQEELTRIVSTVAQSAYKKIPGVGPRAVKVGNAAVYALSEMRTTSAVGQLAMLKVRVKFGTAQKEIEKAFNAAAEALGLPRDQIEEMGVPTYGLEVVGLRTETFGDYKAELRVDGSDTVIRWSDLSGKPLKAVPAKVKAEFKDDLKELQTAVKDIAAMLPAQSERLDSLFLAQTTWPIATWKERYIDHPLVGTLARRLIWVFKDSDQEFSVIWRDGQFVDWHGKVVELPLATVSLWHPIGRTTEEILAWRRLLMTHEIRQPFKQAHRELYLLTDAERRTSTYSNRFATHILRQHQFNALCAARGWKNKLRLLVDDSYPPASRELPNWGIRAEYWIEGIGDDYGTDTNDSGVFLRIATDQVRFYRTGAATNFAHAGGGGYAVQAAGPGRQNINGPMLIEDVPPLVLSEILRDVDLFVGVASVGNDPTWQDGGPQGRYQNYWQSYSFGDLSETAKTRKAVLESLLPRLTKIRERCRLEEKFLIVRGDIRTYKIHLGSGNILMEPNDQYLCIVPDGRSAESEKMFLPFEGDKTLSIILSKAFLLAGDTKIADPTITRQIAR